MRKLYISIIFLLGVFFANSLYSYSKDIICVLPFIINESLVDEYRLEMGITDDEIDIINSDKNQSNGELSDINIAIQDANQENIELITDIDSETLSNENEEETSDEKSSEAKKIVDKYSVIDGIPRLLVDEINSSKMLLGINYDMMVALFNEADMDNPYTTFSTNIEAASQILEDVFAAKYIVYGEVKKFNATLNKNETMENAHVEIVINLLNLHTKETTTLEISRDNVSHEYRGQMYMVHDAYFLESALGIATVNILDEVVDVLIAELETPPLEATIIRIDNDRYSTKFYINMGKSKGVVENDVFDIYQQTFLFTGTNNAQYQNIISNIGIYSTIGNTTSKYLENRPETITNAIEEVRYTSDMLADYLRSITINEYVGKAIVVKAYENFSEMEVYIKESIAAEESENSNKSDEKDDGGSAQNENALDSKDENSTQTQDDDNTQNEDEPPVVQEKHANHFVPRLLMKAIKIKN